jgi:hypothetical protein
MSTDTAAPEQPPAGSGRASTHGPLYRFLFVHEVDDYPTSGKRTGYLALAVLATIVLYYTYYTQTGVTPNILQDYHVVQLLRVDRDHLQPHRRLRLPAGQ